MIFCVQTAVVAIQPTSVVARRTLKTIKLYALLKTRKLNLLFNVGMNSKDSQPLDLYDVNFPKLTSKSKDDAISTVSVLGFSKIDLPELFNNIDPLIGKLNIITSMLERIFEHL